MGAFEQLGRGDRRYCGGGPRGRDRTRQAGALEFGLRILSHYKLGGDRRIYIITEADRSSTCILLPEEY